MEFTTSFEFGFDGVEMNMASFIAMVIIVAFVILIPFIVVSLINSRQNGETVMTSRDLAYGSVCLALSFALSLVGLSLPFGGTITFASLLPISVYCHYAGFRKCVPFCLVYMLLNLLQHPWIVSVWSALLDYIIPYMALSAVGLFPYRKDVSGTGAGTELKKNLGYFIGMTTYILIRFPSHVLSGILFWDYSAEYGMTSLGYSLAYNSFCLIDWLIVIIVSVPILASRSFNKSAEKINV